MVDGVRTNGSHEGAFDDERLLAHVMGLNDPEVAAAAEDDDDLRRRLAELHADLEEVGAQVRAVVPQPGAAYTDLGDQRWAALRSYVAVATPRPRAARRWLRLAVPVTVVAVALVAGVTILSRGGTGERYSARSATSGLAAPKASAGPNALGTHAASGAHLSAQFGLVVVARAGAVRQGVQSFAVVRTLKGTAPRRTLPLRVLSKPATAGRLQLLLLRPSDTFYGNAGGESAPASPRPTPGGPLLAPSQLFGMEAVGTTAEYRYEGAPAYGRQLPAGTDPATVMLP